MARESAYRVAIANANVPNMLGQISTAMAQAGLNIHNMVNKSRGDMAYTLVDVDSPVAARGAGRAARDRRRAGGALPAGGLSAVVSGTDSVGRLASREDVVAGILELRAQLGQIGSSSRPFHLRTLPATITVSTLERSISETTAPGTWLSGATLIAVASRMMMSASLPGVSEPVFLSSRRPFAPLIVA